MARQTQVATPAIDYHHIADYRPSVTPCHMTVQFFIFFFKKHENLAFSALPLKQVFWHPFSHQQEQQ